MVPYHFDALSHSSPLNYLVINTPLCAALGFFGTHVAQYIKPNLMLDPRAGLICGTAAGIAASLCLLNKSHLLRKIIGLTALYYLPIRMCQRLKIPVTLNMTLTMTSVVLITDLFIYSLSSKKSSVKKVKIKRGIKPTLQTI